MHPSPIFHSALVPEGTPGHRSRAVWLFPATYAVHLAEELRGADGFVAWLHRAIGMSMAPEQLVVWNLAGFALLCAGCALVWWHPRYRWIEIALSLAVLGNTAAHAVASVATWTYSPGLLSAIVLWLPLGVIRLRSAHRAATKRAARAGHLVGWAAILAPLAVMALAAR